MTTRIGSWLVLASLIGGVTGCVVAAAGAGAGGAFYLTDRGAESEVQAPVDRAFDATRKAFEEMGITEGKSTREDETGRVKRSLEGTTPSREINVTIASSGTGSHVEVVARYSTVRWDKDLARKILARIVDRARE
jgi:hypothetical protein